MFFGVRLFSISVLALLFSVGTAFGQPPPPKGGGGANLDVGIAASPNPALWGDTVTLQGSADGGAPQYVFRYLWICKAAIDPNNLPFSGPDDDFREVCAVKAGEMVAMCQATDRAGATGYSDALIVQVEAPDKFVIEVGVVDSVGTPMTGVHEFVVMKDDKVAGKCIVKACVSEKVWKLNEQEPTDWEFTGCSVQQAPQFYFLGGTLYDKRVFAPGPEFAGSAEGDVVFERYQRVKIDVPNCDGDDIEVLSERLLYQVIKKNATTVTFKVTEAPEGNN